MNRKTFIDFLEPIFGEIYEVYIGEKECEKVLPENEMSIINTLTKFLR
jgi:hypothetical protein